MNLQTYRKIILARKEMIGLLVLVAASIAMWDQLRIPVQYEARVHILPVVPAWENNEGVQIGPVIGGLAEPFRTIHLSLRESIYWELYSRVLADAVIQELGLQRHYHAGTMSEARSALEGHRIITLTPEGSLLVSITDQDAAMAVAIANAYAAQLDLLDRAQQAVVTAHRKRFVQRQIEQATARLVQVEEAGQSNRLLASIAQPIAVDGGSKDAQASTEKRDDKNGNEINSPMLRTLALKQQVMEAEVELAVLRRYATANHPEVLLMEARLRALWRAIARSEQETARGGRKDFTPALDQLPRLILADVRLARETTQSTGLYIHWRTILEGIQIEESLDLPRVWVLDQAIPEERPRWIWQTVFVAGYVAMLFGVFLAFWFAYLDRLRKV